MESLRSPHSWALAPSGNLMSDRIAFVKTGWSDYYRGGPVVGRHNHIKEYDEAHECLNFLASSNGSMYAYIPPIGEEFRPPQPKISTGWLVVFVAAKNGSGPLTIVGWYQNATFNSEYEKRSQNAGEIVPARPNGEEYRYCLKAHDAHLIPPEDREIKISGAHFRRAPIIYVRGNNKDDEWRSEFAALALKLISGPSEEKQRKRKTVDADHNKKVENAAIKVAMKLYKSKGYKVQDKQSLNCGYDLLAEKGSSQVHLEVKGTASPDEQFFISRNEWKYSSHPNWHLCIVTSALSKPETRVYTRKQIERKFNLEPMSYHATTKR
jgi:hypothetical protein